MKPIRIVFTTLISLLILSTLSFAGDFGWMKDFNIQAKLDPSGLRARLEARFKVGDADIDLVLGSVDEPADAYMLFRLGEMSRRPTAQVMEQYKTHKDQGWGVLAKNLGIKPGSQEFKDLKQGQDLYHQDSESQSHAKGKGKSKARK